MRARKPERIICPGSLNIQDSCHTTTPSPVLLFFRNPDHQTGPSSNLQDYLRLQHLSPALGLEYSWLLQQLAGFKPS